MKSGVLYAIIFILVLSFSFGALAECNQSNGGYKYAFPLSFEKKYDYFKFTSNSPPGGSSMFINSIQIVNGVLELDYFEFGRRLEHKFVDYGSGFIRDESDNWSDEVIWNYNLSLGEGFIDNAKGKVVFEEIRSNTSVALCLIPGNFSNITTQKCNNQKVNLDIYSYGELDIENLQSGQKILKQDSCVLVSKYWENEPSSWNYTSSCSGNDCYVLQPYCVREFSTSEIMSCPNGCENGACIQNQTATQNQTDSQNQSQQDPECTPSCADKECGDDGCKGVCGWCVSSKRCSIGKCVNYCGNGVCDSEESCISCSEDCGNCEPACSGCLVENECYPIGNVSNGEFCSDNKTFLVQSDNKETCENNFECKSDLCIDKQCASSGFFAKIFRWFKNLF